MNLNAEAKPATSAYYSFNDKKRAIALHRHDMPQPWINYLSNGRFHAFISQAGGGFAWWKSPVAYRLTRYRQYNQPIDSPGFYVYIKQKDGTVWSPAFRPCETELDSWRAEHQPGQTCFYAQKDGVQAELRFFVSQTDDVLVWQLNLSSLDGREHELDVYAYVEFAQLTWQTEASYGYYLRHQLNTWYDATSESVNYLFHCCNYPEGYDIPLVYLASSKPVVSYSGNRNTFIGDYGHEALPNGIRAAQLGNDTIECGEPAGALHNRITLAPAITQEVCYYLGASDGAINDLKTCQENRDTTLYGLRRDGEIVRQLDLVDDWWNHHFAVMQCEIPDEAGSRQINTWSVINSVVTGRYSRSVNVDAPGVRGVGFRDTCQDMLAICYRAPEWAAEMLRYLLSLQYSDGHVLHLAFKEEWFEPGTSVHSDDHLWPIYLTYAILAETDDYSLLDVTVPYYGTDTESATVWEHLLQGVAFTEQNLGSHGLPIILSSDWNDTIGRFNKRNQGETVFAAQQYVYALGQLIEIAQNAGKTTVILMLATNLEKQKKAILACAWDGKWWRRAFDDDGKVVGGAECACGKIFLNTQSWSVIAGIGTREQNEQAMQSVSDRLQAGIGLKLLTPSFAGWNAEEGKTPVGYGPGCGENGAIFCHANTWAIIAEALLGNGDRAWEYFSQIIPANVAEKVGVGVYKSEPYAWVSNIVGPENPQFGWGNVNQITGTAPWMDIAATQYILGVRPTLAGLIIAPCVPAAWREFTIRRIFAGCALCITVKQDGSGKRAVKNFTINGNSGELNNQKQAIIQRKTVAGEKTASILLELGS